MWGKPEDVAGECNARLILSDDYGDNECTIRCQLEPDHVGRHREVCRDGEVVIEWEEDERKERPSEEDEAA